MHVVCECGETLSKSVNGITKIPNKIVLIRNSSVYAVCKSCNTEVLIGVVPNTGPRLILSK